MAHLPLTKLFYLCFDAISGFVHEFLVLGILARIQ